MRSTEMQATHIINEMEDQQPINSNYRRNHNAEILINCLPPKNDWYRKNRETMEFGDDILHATRSESQDK